MWRLALPLLAALPAQAEQTFGLVIGIDDYAHITDLQGAVNDARDIADALLGLDADVTLLLNADASRANILDAWEDIIARAAPGDRLIVTYAGHGSNEPEHTPGNEIDGRDENFLLAGFAPSGPATAERIRDDEIADLIARAPDIEVIIVADACHSGTVTRNLNPTLGYRYTAPSDMAGDPLPPPPPRPSGDGQEDVALFLAAVNETEKVPEFLINGQARGALSYAFADGLRGGADANGDQRLTKGEIEAHVRRTVRQVSDGVQLPQSLPVGAEDTELMALRGLNRSLTDLTQVQFSDLPHLTITGASAPLTGTKTGPLADLTLTSGLLHSMVGDVVARVDDHAHLQRVIDKLRVANALLTFGNPTLGVQFAGGDRTYSDGQTVQINVTGRKSEHIVLLNLASDGDIDLIYPLAELGDPMTTKADQQIALSVRVAAPYGADHVIAIETATHEADLLGILQSLDGTTRVAALWEAIRRTPDISVAVFPFFSEPS